MIVCKNLIQNYECPYLKPYFRCIHCVNMPILFTFVSTLGADRMVKPALIFGFVLSLLNLVSWPVNSQVSFESSSLSNKQLLDSANRLVKKENYADALIVYQILLNREDGFEKLDLKINTRYGVARTLSKLGLHQEALANINTIDNAMIDHFYPLKEAQMNKFINLGFKSGLLARLGKYDESMLVFDTSAQLAREMGLKLFEASNSNNKGMIQVDYGKYDLAREEYDLAARLLDSAKGERSRAEIDAFGSSIRDNLAQLEEKLGNKEEALSLFLKNIEILSELIDPDDQEVFYVKNWINAKLSASRILLSMNRLEPVGGLLHEIEQFTNTADYVGKNAQKEELLKLLKEYYGMKNDLGGFRKYSEKWEEHAEFLKAQKEAELLSIIRVLTFQQLRQFQKERESAAALQKEKAKTTAVFVGSGFLLATISVFFVLRLKNRQAIMIEQRAELLDAEKRILETELESQKKDVENLALDITRKHQWTEKLLGMSKSLKGEKSNKHVAHFDDLISEIQSELMVDKNRLIFKERVAHAGHEFFKKLERQFPALTKYERELCSLIRMDLSNKEIAALKGISPSSARIARHRLKKALGLTREQDLAFELKQL